MSQPGKRQRSGSPTHLSLLFERLDGQAVRPDVHDGSQLEPFCWVGSPHRLPILHGSALTALKHTVRRQRGRTTAPGPQEVPVLVHCTQILTRNQPRTHVRTLKMASVQKMKIQKKACKCSDGYLHCCSRVRGNTSCGGRDFLLSPR